MRPTRAFRHSVPVILLVILVSCGETAPSPPPVQTTTITITPGAGASPRDVIVSVGQRVLFINNDSIAHNMTSDPHPDHMDCPDLNQVGFLMPGERRETGNLVTPRTCGFHDHDLPAVTNLHGSITIR